MYDALIVGGGHNGLVCACYLADAGLHVRVLERRDVVGGAAVTEEFFPGFRNSAASYTVGLLHARVIRDLRLHERGLRIVTRPLANFLPLPDGRCLRMGADGGDDASEIARFSQRDAERFPGYLAMISRAAEFVRERLLETPPDIGGGALDAIRGLRVGGALRGAGAEARRDLLELFTRGAGDLLDTWFESEPLKAMLGFDAVVGTYASPYTPGTGYVLLHHVFGEVGGQRGVWGHAIGGMGAITEAMAREAARRGVEISTGAAVRQVAVRAGRVRGVVLEDGTLLEAPIVAANVNPKLLYLDLVDRADLPGEFVARMGRYRCASATLRVNVALSELPDFACAPGTVAQPHHGSGIYIAPSLRYMERAHADAREHGWSKQPIVEMVIPSTLDDSLAPPGAHVASLFCQHFDPKLPDDRTWDEAKEAAADAAIDAVTAYAPNFARSVLGRKVLSPLDLERDFGLVGGDIFHGALGLDQLYSARPLLGYANYRSPVKGLYLCGSGAHPGGGVTGVPGHNAAREIRADLRRRL